MPHTDFDVAVVGAGPVGLTLALYMARAGISVAVLEADDRLNSSPRAMVYLHSVLGDLDELGLLEPMRERAWVDRDGLNLHVPALSEVIRIPNSALDDVDPYPYNLHLGQGEYCEIVLRRLREYEHVTVRFGAAVVAVADDGKVATTTLVSGETVRARYVVGADGARSVVRTAMGATLDGTTWDDRFVATNVRFDFRSLGFKSSNMYVDAEIGCVIAQISPDGLWRCTFQEPLSLPESTVAERIPQFFARLLGPDAEVEVIAYRPYRMHQRLATSLRQGRMVLAGDAAHLTNPTGGLGLTTGLFDVFLLQEVLIAVIRDGSSPDLLDAYAEERSRSFSEKSSPSATTFKRLVYDSRDLGELGAAIEPLRAAAATLEGQRSFLRGLDALRSPRLVAQL